MIEKLFDILKNISTVIAQKSDYRTMLSEIVALLAQGLNAKVCSVYVYNKKADELELSATYGLRPNSVGRVKMKPGEGITGTSFKENRIKNVKDPETHPNFKHFEDTGELEFKSLLAIPLNIATQCMGVLVIQSDISERFPDSVVVMAEAIGTQLANLILNANVLDSLAEEPRQLEKEAANNDLHKIIIGEAGNTGIAIGKAYIFKGKNPFESISPAMHLNNYKEQEVLTVAIRKIIEETLVLEKKALSMISEADASIFYAHLLFLEDKTLISKIRNEICNRGSIAEYAIKTVYKEYSKRFSQMDDQAFKEKIMDLKDVMSRLANAVLSLKKKNLSPEGWKQEWTFSNKENIIIIANEILPSDLLKMPTGDIKGIVCEKGGVSAHISILAKAFNIPAMMRVKNATTLINDGDEVILDCFSEKLHVLPTEEIKQHYSDVVTSIQDESFSYQDMHAPGITIDGKKITLKANIGLVSETTLANKYLAEGIGLYRTEFLFMIRDRLPTEQEQYEIYSKVFNYVNCKDVSIRALDAGSDKPLPYLNIPEEDNPALGMRGIRLLLAQPDILKPHLKAILRAGVKGNLNLLLPMISTIDELLRIKKILCETASELTEQGIEHAKNYKVGIMIEVPSVIFALKNIINEVDFVSIGTNDLFQYTFASDRTNEAINNKNLQVHPVFIRILKHIADICSKNNRKGFSLSVCGELAGNSFFTPLIIGSGIYELSMTPNLIPPIKNLVRKLTVPECIDITQKAITLSNENEVISILKDFFTGKNLTIKGKTPS